MAANRMNGPFTFATENNEGSAAASAFYERHRQTFQEVLDAVAAYAREGDGNSLVLMDSALLGICQHIRDRLSKQGVKVQAAPPTLGDILSQKIQ